MKGMIMTDFSQFDEILTDDMKEDIAAAAEGGDYPDLPLNDYVVDVQNIEVKMTKKEPPRPMLSVVYKILEGEYSNRLIFSNYMLNVAFGIHNANEIMRSMLPEDDDFPKEDIKLDKFNDYAEMALDLCEHVQEQGYEYLLSYTKNNSDYDVYEILEIYEGSE